MCATFLRRIGCPLVLAFVVLIVPFLAFSQPQGTILHLELQVSTGVSKTAFPNDGSVWAELYPNEATDFAQTAYQDDGDGQISVGDNIQLDGNGYRITWVGVTHHLNCAQHPHRAYEPTVLPSAPNPTGEIWTQVYPATEFGTQHQVDDWIDNGDAQLSAGDELLIGGQDCTLTGSLLTVQVEPGAVPNHDGSWGTLKAAFGRIF